MSNSTLDQRIAALKAIRESGVLELRNGETQIKYRSFEELNLAIAQLEAEREARTNSRRRFRTIRFIGRSGY